MLGLDTGVGNLKILLPASLLPMSARHLRVARSVAAHFRKARLYRLAVGPPPADERVTAASFACRSACSFPSTPWCAGTIWP